MKKTMLYCLIILLSGCNKKQDLLYGDVNVSGQITDIVSGDPIPNAIVKLYKLKQIRNFIGYTSMIDEIIMFDTSDINGNYAISIAADGAVGFELSADPQSDLFVSSDYTVNNSHQRITAVGTHILNQACHRSAYAKITLTNIEPIDTPYFISASSVVDDIVINNYSKDTVMYLKLVGRDTYPNSIRFNKNNNEDNTYQKTVGAWDTISMQFNY
ncbi:hypothetical protein [Crocinitomix catalasitica]|uniref:hypothetical protein n=1 Tax=Crocinitomix catalasitica TaxID=184607 RepID=UPI0004838BA5|nr:hypothetical protein [Crocinitomix catalasitica]